MNSPLRVNKVIGEGIPSEEELLMHLGKAVDREECRVFKGTLNVNEMPTDPTNPVAIALWVYDEINDV